MANSEDLKLRFCLGASYVLPLRFIPYPHHPLLENLQSVVFLQREERRKFAVWKRGNFIIYSNGWIWD